MNEEVTDINELISVINNIQVYKKHQQLPYTGSEIIEVYITPTELRINNIFAQIITANSYTEPLNDSLDAFGNEYLSPCAEVEFMNLPFR